MVRRGNWGTEATGLLTGQLEGFKLLSGLNFPDRVGMQQAEGTSRGWKTRKLGLFKLALKFPLLFCFYCYYPTIFYAITQNKPQKLTDMKGQSIND